MKFAFYSSMYDNDPRVVDLTDEDVLEMIRGTTQLACSVEDCVGPECPHKNTEAFSPIDIDDLRHNANVRSMSMLVLEVDGGSREAAATIADALVGLRHGVYSTHSHRGGDGKWNLRFLVWLSRPVRVAYRRSGKSSIPMAEDEWYRFYKTIVRRLGIADLVDPLGDPSRIWFIPGHARGATPFSGYDDGPPIDVDAILATAPQQNFVPPAPPAPAVVDLAEVAEVLSAYRKSRVRRDDAEDQEKGALIGRLLDGEPLAAPGGNAAPTPEEPPADLPKGRGIAILRASGICVNVLPPEVPDEAYVEIFRRSIEAMCFGNPAEAQALYDKLAESLERNRARREAWVAEKEADRAKVRALAERMIAQRKATVAPPPVAAPEPESSEWLGLLRRKSKGVLAACGFNAYLFMLYDPELRGAIRWNEVEKCLVTSGAIAGDPEVADVIVANYISIKYDVDIEPSTVGKQLACVAFENRFDPIRDYLRSITWDGESRIDAEGGWLVKYAEAEAGTDGYVCDAGRKWLVQAVARALSPGCKADTVLLFEGDQGRRKSSMFKALGGEWFCAVQQLVLGDKDSKMLASGQWIIELAEMASMRRSEKRAIKAFFSDEVDKFRLPFGRAITKSPRRCVFVATTNDGEDDLDDLTGNRRYWPVRCGRVDLAALARDRDQLWAEAVYLYDRHVRECGSNIDCGCWWFDPDDPRVASRTDARLVENPAEAAVDAWWHAMSSERRPKAVTTFDVAIAALDCTKDRVYRHVQMDVGAALRRLGFKKNVIKEGRRSKRVFVPSPELLAAPQSEEGKMRDRRTGMVKPVAVAA